MPDAGKRIKDLLRKSISQAGDHQDPVPVILGTGQDVPKFKNTGSRKKYKKRKP